MEQAKSIAEMTVDELRRAALHCGNRFLATSYSQMAEAKTQLALGDRVLASRHHERAKRAYLLAQESEADQVKRAIAKIEQQRADGTALDKYDGVHRGIAPHISERDRVRSNGQVRGESAMRSAS